jgi:hypothetical protein
MNVCQFWYTIDVLRAIIVKYAALRAHSLELHSRFAIWTKHNTLW